MKTNIIHFCTLLMIAIAAASLHGANYRLIIKVIPDTIPPREKVFITGDHDKLGNWDPNEVPLHKQKDGTWQRTIRFKQGTLIEYKITRGSWHTERVDSTGLEFANEKLKINKDTTIAISVYDWRDTFRRKGITKLSKKRLQNKAGVIELYDGWKYHPGDDADWAKPDFADEKWISIDSRMLEDTYKKLNWPGIGWFRLHLEIDSTLWQHPLSLTMNQPGASEVYLNGYLVYRFGQVAKNSKDEIALIDQNPKPFLFANKTRQVLAVRYSNHSANYINEIGGNPGFLCRIINLNQHIEGRAQEIRLFTTYQMIFTIIPIVLSFLHFMLFLFNPRARENIYYAFCMLGFAGLSFGIFQLPFTTDFYESIWYNYTVFISINTALLFGLLTAYTNSYEHIPKQFYLFLAGAIIFIGLALTFPGMQIFNYFMVFLIISALELLRLIFKSTMHGQISSWLTGIGFILLMISIGYQILIDTDVVDPIGGNNIVYVYGVLALSIVMSINLARDFAKMDEKITDQQREAREREIEKRLLQVDNRRKSQELEEARQLQLALLPDKLPDVPSVEMAVSMRTATEVGGDYYDFHVAGDGTLSVAIGDATGHGMKAGNMVIAIKSLFSTLPKDLPVVDFFNRCSRIIKGMNLKQLYMCLSLLRIRNQNMMVSSAGMPPILHYRSNDGYIGEIVLKGLPLGAVNSFEYQERQITLSSGDTFLLMTDGLPELFNERDEILDYPALRTAFEEVAGKTPHEIVSHLNALADQWRGRRALGDDMTLLVLKIK
ncbi:MAG: SpoIIE family protein phosphatase [Caldithrix sp.]|nr:SpoIIE family protein phosphatase [Caldithrix sp.]